MFGLFDRIDNLAYNPCHEAVSPWSRSFIPNHLMRRCSPYSDRLFKRPGMGDFSGGWWTFCSDVIHNLWVPLPLDASLSQVHPKRDHSCQPAHICAPSAPGKSVPKLDCSIIWTFWRYLCNCWISRHRFPPRRRQISRDQSQHSAPGNAPGMGSSA